MWTKENIPDQSGRQVIVTGANAGIGYETALALYEKGATVTLACRNMDSARKAMAQLKQLKAPGEIEVALLNLTSLTSVKQFASAFSETHARLDLLINNAGVMVPPLLKTEEGFELQFGVNFIGHFALTGLLYPLLRSTEGSRIVTVSSMAYLRGRIDFKNLRAEKDYDPMREYCQSKLADILLSVELDRRIGKSDDRVISTAAQPGANKTTLARYMSQEEYAAAVERIGELMDPWQGALPSLMAAVSEEAEGGELFSPDSDGGYRGYPEKTEIEPHGLDQVVASQLWQLAEEVTGIRFPG